MPATLLCLATTGQAAAAFAGCDPDMLEIERGETRDLLLCADAITADSAVGGLAKAGIELRYRQYLQHCTPTDRRPGFYLELSASAGARSARLQLRNPTTRDLQCELAIEVPDRRPVEPVSLQPAGAPGEFLLRIAAPDDLDFSATCAAGLTFPPGQGPRITMDGPAACNATELSARVRLEPGPQRTSRVHFTARDRAGRPVPAVGLVAPPPPFFASDMAEADARYVDLNGIRTRYFAAGDGEVMLLVHGGQPSSADYNALQWQQNFGGLAEHFRVIALDRVGQGRTANPPDLAVYERYYELVVEHLLGFMDALDIRQAHLVGHSQGGWPVTRIALDHPDRVRSLVIVDSTMIGPAENATQAVRFYLYLQNQLHPPTGETLQSIRRGMEMFTYTNNYVTMDRVRRILTLTQTAAYAQARNWFAQSLMSPAHPSFRKLKSQLWSELEDGQLQVPTLIVWGRQDPEGSFPTGERMAARLQTAGSPVSFHAFDHAGHVAYMEYPDRFNQVVTEFAHSH